MQTHQKAMFNRNRVLSGTSSIAPLKTFVGTRKKMTHNWSEMNVKEFSTAVVEKRVVLLKHKHQPTRAMLQALRLDNIQTPKS